jgi:hypothetical protein
MTVERYMVDKDGRRLPPGTRVVPDGGRVVSSTLLMDASDLRLPLADADQAHDAMCRDTCSGGYYRPADWAYPTLSDAEAGVLEAQAITAQAMMVADLAKAGRAA